MNSCPFCGKEFEDDPSVCPHCGQVIHGSGVEDDGAKLTPPPGPPAPPVSQGIPAPEGEDNRKTVPFEDTSFSFFGGMFETIKLALFQPASFFRDYRFDGGIGRPMVFALVVGWFSIAVRAVWSLLFSASIMSVMSKYIPNSDQLPFDRFGSQFMFSSIGALVSVFIAPILIILGLFIMAGIYHLFLMMVNGAKRGFETTFNVVSYSISARLFMIIPFCGSGVAWIYGLVISIIGLPLAHKTEGWKGAFAVLVPFLLCCCLVLFVIFFFGMAIAGIASHH